MSDDTHRRAESFLELFNKGKEFTEELLQENQRLRYRLAALETDDGTHVPEIELLRQQIERLTAENAKIQAHFEKVESENRDFAERYVEVEEQNNNLANLYVASYQLHSTLDFREVIQIVQEIVINLVGAEVFAILLRDEKTDELKAIASEGNAVLPEMKDLTVTMGRGVLGKVLESGESHFGDPEGRDPQIEQPIAAVPLKIKDHVIGLIVVYRLLQQKHGFTAVDYELFSLLAAHSATAIYSSKLYSTSERKLSTIQGFLDLLTTN